MQSLAAAPAQGHRTLERHEGDVRAKRGRYFDQVTAEGGRCERIQAAKHGTGVGTSAAKPGPDRDPLIDLDVEARRPPCRRLVR
jgi:hypothetical protein